MDSWDDAWDRADSTGQFTMDQCCEKADAVDPDHDYGSDSDSSDDDSDDSDDTSDDES